MKKKKKGFTLVELLVVIAIIAILAAIITPNAFKAIEKSKVASAESDYKAIKTAALSYYSDAGVWPTNGANDKGFVIKPDGASATLANSWNGPYLEKWPNKNPWGGTYTFNNGTKDKIDNVKYITLTDVPTSATDRLEADLDGGSTDTAATTGVVRYDTNKTTVYLIISEQ